MKILIVSPFLPYPLDAGGKVRLYNMLKGLARWGLTVVFLYVHKGELDENELEQSRKQIPEAEFIVAKVSIPLFARLMFVFSYGLIGFDAFLPKGYNSFFKEVVERKGIDLVQFEFTQIANLLPAGILQPKILVVHELRHIKKSRELSSLNYFIRLFAWLKSGLTKAEERLAMKKFDYLVTMSADDSAATAEIAGSKRIQILPNGVDTETIVYQELIKNVPKKLFYLGWYGNRQNVEALENFYAAIWPRLAEASGVEMLVIGRELPNELKIKYRASGWHLFEFLDETELAQELANGILVVPLLSGGGTRLKILEAMARGNPVVSTSVGAEGIDAEPGKDIIIRDKPEEFAQAVIRLLSDDDAYAKIAGAARACVASKYGWGMIIESALGFYKGITKN